MSTLAARQAGRPGAGGVVALWSQNVGVIALLSLLCSGQHGTGREGDQKIVSVHNSIK